MPQIVPKSPGRVPDERSDLSGGISAQNARKFGRRRTDEVPKADPDYYRVALGGCIKRAMTLCGWNLNELANAIAEAAGRDYYDPRHVGKWMTGEKPPQWPLLFAVRALRPNLILAMADLGREDGVEILTTIRLQR